MASRLTIGRLAKVAGVHVQTIRYYERRKLLAPIDRMPSGYRLYGSEGLDRLHFIKNAQALGFTLSEVSELLNLRVSSSARCRDVQGRAQAKLTQVEDKMRALRSLAKALRGLIGNCQANQPTDHCPILRSIEKERRGHHDTPKTIR